METIIYNCDLCNTTYQSPLNKLALTANFNGTLYEFGVCSKCLSTWLATFFDQQATALAKQLPPPT